MTNQLFCYGTLEFADVMQAVSGALPPSRPATLKGYACYRIKGKSYPGIIADEGSEVVGTLYAYLSRRQLEKLDAYEGALYRRQRVLVDTDNGVQRAWAYVVPTRFDSVVSHEPWCRDSAERRRGKTLRF